VISCLSELIYKPNCCNKEDSYFCNDCITEWTHDQFRVSSHQWLCPRESCKRPYTFTELFDLVNKNRSLSELKDVIEFKNVLCEIGLKLYLRSDDEIRVCPAEGCTYAGHIPRESLKLCLQEIECPTCKTTWFDKD